MDEILQVKNLCKKYDGFALDHVSFTLPRGCIMGFIGENGAGKSTTIKAILNLVRRDQGEILIFGQDNIQKELEIKERIGVVFDSLNLPETLRAQEVGNMMKSIYHQWDQPLFAKYLEQFDLPMKKTIKDYSRGMKMKLAIAVALSHNAQLLLLDEATSGLDPIVRDEILDILLEFIQDDSHGVLFSSHITGDLEKIADYVTFIHKGQIYFSEPKDLLLEKYGILKCTESELAALPSNAVRGIRRHQFGVEALVEKRALSSRHVTDKASIEDMMLFIARGEHR
ncbi:MAG: ABC transporter ATP-binding protein [Oscillospiraceae bacterium]|nr:ABC transporter ATP-binding protein [Oscillospiraceae bacterium]